MRRLVRRWLGIDEPTRSLVHRVTQLELSVSWLQTAYEVDRARLNSLEEGL